MLKIPCFAIFLPVLIFSFNIALSAMHTNCTYDYNRRVSQESLFLNFLRIFFFFLVKILTRYILHIFTSNVLNEFSIFIRVHDTMKLNLNHENESITISSIKLIKGWVGTYILFFAYSSFDSWIFALNLSVREDRFFFFSYISKMDVRKVFNFYTWWKSFNNFFEKEKI